MARAHVAINHSMSGIIAADDPTVSQAMEALAGWESESTATQPSPEPAPEASANEPTAPATDDVTDQAAKSKDEGPAATEDPKAPKSQDTTTKKDAKSAPEKSAEAKTDVEPSKYEKARQRQEKSWADLNAEKATVRTLADTVKQRAAELDRREHALAAKEAKLSQPRHKPEDYESLAARNEAEAKKLDDAGDYTKAEKLRWKAEEAREYAQQLRANPPKPDPTEAQQAEAFKQSQKEWWTKSALDYPDVAKEGTPQRAALIALLQNEPDIVNDPKGMYYASRLVQAETSAAAVPKLTKDLEAASAKIKELEQLLAVDGDGSANSGNNGPKTFEQMSNAEQLATLEAEARAMSS
jgi:hypothetical protein